ncbi:MAG: 50S ribosomal protein L11 methyltransferase [Paludibacteraceae bacterium]|nr:50S ribosomal protein L11 methyltransferase [Paludibacteraceae bacterium]
MQYLKLTIDTTNMPEYQVDVLVYELGEIGFESFETSQDTLNAYVQQTVFNPESLNELVGNGYKIEEMPDKNWNEEWEKHFFQPIVIGNQCVIHSTFHTEVPQAQYDIVIDPKMSFGTGHHATTSNMLSWILDDDMQGKCVLDMGCGTGVLGILAKKKGAQSVLCIDIDQWCFENAQESAQLNQTDITVMLGDASLLAGKTFDIILANINRNILLNDMASYVQCLPQGGVLYMSGFYTQDIPVIEACANNLGLTKVGVKEQNNWVAVKFTKQ